MSEAESKLAYEKRVNRRNAANEGNSAISGQLRVARSTEVSAPLSSQNGVFAPLSASSHSASAAPKPDLQSQPLRPSAAVFSPPVYYSGINVRTNTSTTCPPTTFDYPNLISINPSTLYPTLPSSGIQQPVSMFPPAFPPARYQPVYNPTQPSSVPSAAVYPIH